jgi:hypothetical protein
MAFSSVGTEIKSGPGNGPYCFRIDGQIYHLISFLYPNETNKTGYGLLYISNSAEEKQKGLETNQTNGVWLK